MESKRVEEEYLSFANGNLWPMAYQRVGLRSQGYPYTSIEAKKMVNKSLNRYRDVNPFDHSRIILRRKGLTTDYINANLVKVDRADRQYILTQGPLVLTAGHFWLMAWEQNSPAIIMLNKIVEKTEIKCYYYWPHDRGDGYTVNYPDVNMSITQISETDCNYYTVRLLRMTYHDTEESRDIWHFHYTTWPDFEVPQSPNAFLNFLYRVREEHLLECVGDKGPAIVHCSAGIGRSGTFCLVDSVLVLIEKEGQANVDIQEILLDMRRYRMGLIQTSEQLRFSYKAIVEGIKRLDPTYVPNEEENTTEAIYAAVPLEVEGPPCPPPRGESLGRPPARPLPAIPASASMVDVTEGVYARRRARVAQHWAVPSLSILAAAAAPGAPPREITKPPPPVPTLARLATNSILCPPPLDLQPSEIDRILDNSLTMYESPKLRLNEAPPAVVIEAHQDKLDSEIYGLSLSEGQPKEESLTVDASVHARIDGSQTTDSLLSDAPADAVEGVEDVFPMPVDFGNMEILTKGESDDSDKTSTPPTPPTLQPRVAAPRDEQRDTPSPASSEYTDEDIPDDEATTADTTETSETTDAVQSIVGGAGALRRRRAEQLAERVATMQKRQHEADRWQYVKRSLFKPLAFSVGFLAVTGVLIYAYAKH